MDHIVKLTEADMAGGSNWAKLIFELDPTVDPGTVAAVELGVHTVFFLTST